MNDPRPTTISTLPCESRSRVANSWNTLTGSAALRTVTALVRRIRRVRAAAAPRMTAGAESREARRWCPPIPKTSRPAGSACSICSTRLRSRSEGLTARLASSYAAAKLSIPICMVTASRLPRDRGFRGRGPPGREVQDGADDARGEDRPRDPRRPQGLEPEQRVQREDSRPDQAECHGAGRVDQRVLDPARRHEEAVPPMHARHRDDHHRNDERRSDRAQETECHEQTAGELGETGRGREEAAGPEADLLEESAGSRDPVAAEPAENLLCAVRRQGESQDQPYDQQSRARRQRIGRPCDEELRRIHGISLQSSSLRASPVRRRWRPNLPAHLTTIYG